MERDAVCAIFYPQLCDLPEGVGVSAWAECLCVCVWPLGWGLLPQHSQRLQDAPPSALVNFAAFAAPVRRP